MSEQTSSVFIGPFRDNENDCYLRQLWDRKLYRFLRSWFRTVEMDTTIGPDERGLIRIKKTDSGESWGIPHGEGGGSSYDYASYFKVYDASSGGTCKIGVKDGSTVGALLKHCGGVWINGVYAATLNADTGAITSASTIYAWLVSRLTEDGEESEVKFTTSSSAPAPGGIVGSTQLLGRASVVSDGEGGYVVSSINQDYLRGGEHITVLYADCGLLTVEE